MSKKLWNLMDREVIPNTGIVDLGCGANCKWGHLTRGAYLGVDLDDPAEDALKKAEYFSHVSPKYVKGDMRDVDSWFFHVTFQNICLIMDSIEHIPHQDGVELITNLQEKDRFKIVIFTPDNTDLPDGEFLPNQGYPEGLQRHLSGWRHEHFDSLGFHEVHRLPGFHADGSGAIWAVWRPSRFFKRGEIYVSSGSDARQGKGAQA